MFSDLDMIGSASVAGDCGPTQQRLVNITVKSGSAEETVLHCTAPNSATFKSVQGISKSRLILKQARLKWN